MEALFTPIWPAFTEREVSVDYKGPDFPVYRRDDTEGMRVRRAYITFRKAADRGPQETWVVKKIKLIAPEHTSYPLVLTDLEGRSEYSSRHVVPWWLMKAVVQGIGFIP